MPPFTEANTWPMVSSIASAMPLRSSTTPMKVKNGIASRVWLDMMPSTRSGSACSSCGPNAPAWMPISENARPTAASENATG